MVLVRCKRWSELDGLFHFRSSETWVSLFFAVGLGGFGFMGQSSNSSLLLPLTTDWEH